MSAPKLSAANWITIALVAAGVVSSFAVAQYQIGSMENRIEAMNRDATERVTKFEMVANAYESRIRAVEIAQASQTSDLRNIQIGINEIKDQIRRITGPN